MERNITLSIENGKKLLSSRKGITLNEIVNLISDNSSELTNTVAAAFYLGVYAGYKQAQEDTKSKIAMLKKEKQEVIRA